MYGFALSASVSTTTPSCYLHIWHPWFLDVDGSEQTKTLLTSAAFVHLKHAEVSKFTKNLSPGSRTVLLSGPTGMRSFCLMKNHFSIVPCAYSSHCCLELMLHCLISCRTLPAIGCQSSSTLLWGRAFVIGCSRLLNKGNVLHLGQICYFDCDEFELMFFNIGSCRCRTNMAVPKRNL